MVVSLTACGGGDNASTSSSDTGTKNDAASAGSSSNDAASDDTNDTASSGDASGDTAAGKPDYHEVLKDGSLTTLATQTQWAVSSRARIIRMR